MTTNTALTRTQRKLERLELEHLRKLTGELQSLLEMAQQLHRSAEESAEFWQRHAMQLQEALHDGEFTTHRRIGITKDGEMMVVRHDA